MHTAPRSSRGLGRQILILVARVQIPYGVHDRADPFGSALLVSGQGERWLQSQEWR